MVLSARRPNILVILCDDLGYGDVGVLADPTRPEGTPSFSTPNLDDLAAHGHVLEGMYCSSPVCAPSRASLLSGRSQGYSSLRDNRFDDPLEEGPTLASVLRHAGYRTAAIGKWGLPGHPAEGEDPSPRTWPAYPTRRGFEEFLGSVRHADGHEHYPKEGLHRGAKEVWHGEEEISRHLDGCYTTDLFTAYAKHWIIRRYEEASEDPFFLYLALDTPHAVQELPPGPYPAGGGSDGGLQWIGESGRMITTATGTPDTWYHPETEAARTPDGLPWPDVYRRYGTAVRRIDDAVGDLRALLRDLGIEQDTLVLFTSDNGPSIESYLKEDLEADFFRSFGPFDGIKRDCWEGGVRVGALAAWPARIPAGSTSTAGVQFHDLMPTFAEAAGVPCPSRSDGVSLIPLLTGQGEQRESTIYVEYRVEGETPGYEAFAAHRRGRPRGQMQMLRLGDLVGVRYDVQDAGDPFEIYDVLSDPGQREDLGADAALQSQFHAAASRRRVAHPGIPRPYDGAPIAALDDGSPEVARSVIRQGDAGVGEVPWLPLLPAGPGPGTGSVAGRAADRYVSQHRGEIFAATAGAHRISLRTASGEAPDEATLRLHDALVLEVTEPGSDAAATVRLAAGRHPYRIDHRGEDLEIVLDAVTGPDVEVLAP